MKYVVVLGDGMADEPLEKLNNKTPLEYAKTETMDKLAKVSKIGLAHTIPEGMKPGSDTANLAVMGYYPKKYYTGRSPLEALSIGVDMKATDISLRANIVTLSDDDKAYEDKTIIDHSASEISTEDASILINAVKELIDSVQSSYKLHVIIFGSVALIISSPNFCNFRQAWKGSNNSVPFMIIFGKSNKWTSKGSNIPFLVAIITLGCSSGGKDLIKAATSSAAFHFDN